MQKILNFLVDNFPDSHNWTYEYLAFRVRESAYTKIPGFFALATDSISGEILGVLSVSFKDITGSKPLLIAELGDAYTKVKSYKICENLSNNFEDKLSHDIDLAYVRKSIFGALAFRVFADLDIINPDVVVGYPNAIALKSWTRRLGLNRLVALDIDYVRLPCFGFFLGKFFPAVYATKISQEYSSFYSAPSDEFDESILKELEANYLNRLKVLPLANGLVSSIDTERRLTFLYANKRIKSKYFFKIIGLLFSPRLKILCIPTFLVPAILKGFIPLILRHHKPAVVRPKDVSLEKQLGNLANQILFCDVP